IPFGTYNLIVRYIGYENYNAGVTLNASNSSVTLDIELKSTGYELEDVVVVSVLQGQRKALNQQLTADEIKNVISREEMEKFPDMNTAEVLQRMPGVNIDRSQGEGRFVYIRGTDPRLTSVTVDGQKLATTEDANRVTDLGIINANQLSSIEVSKSLTPEMDASGIGGQVNLVTRSPFDYVKPRLTLDAGGGYSPQGKEPQYRFAGSYVGFLGKEKKLGYTVSGSYNQTNINGQRIDMSYSTINTVNRVELPFHLSQMRLQNRESNRERYGASGILSFKPNKNSSFYLRGMFNQYNNDLVLSDKYFRMQEALWFDSTNLRSGRMDYSNIHEPKTSRLSTYAFGGKHGWGVLKLDYDLNYSSGAERTPEGNERVRSEWTSAAKPNFTLDWSDTDYPVFTMSSTDRPANYIFDPSNYRIDTQELKDIQNSNTNVAGTINASLAYNLLGISGELKSGLKYAMDEKSRTGVTTRYTWQGAGIPRMSEVASDDTIPDFLGNKYNFAPMINVDSARALIDKWAEQNPGLRNDIGGSAIWVSGDGVGGIYTNNEKIYSFYLMTNMNFGRFTIIAGFRDEYTATDYNGKNILFDSRGDVSSVEPAIAKSNYNNIFPHLHLKYKLGLTTNIRASANQSIARPNYYDLAPYYFFDPQERRLITGNPDLAPTYATNYDLMFEHYFKGIGVASVGFFYKDINDLIYTQTSTDTTGELAGFIVSTPQNAGSALLYGFELNWQQQFTFLPAFLNGFGIYGNYTFTKSEANLEFREWTVIPGQAGDVGNIGLSYEKYGLTARLSLNYRSVVLDGIGTTPEYDFYSDESTRIDFTSIYEFSKRLSVYLNLMNLTNTIDRDYLGKYSRPTSIEYYGFSGTLGFRVNL
ncbi:MAG: TonB-dependent receptor, partial [Bacteroidales bacterium]|nr:TonB-dependent receptor [Bacteroidales bacterium]